MRPVVPHTTALNSSEAASARTSRYLTRRCGKGRIDASSPGLAADRGDAARHRLDVRHAEGLVHARHDQCAGAPRGVARGGRRHLPAELVTAVETEIVGQPAQALALGSVADDDVAQVRVAIA